MTADGSDRSFGAPRFDVVLRGYDRRQVDEHLSRLNRVVARMRGELDAARSQLAQPPQPPIGVVTPPGGRPRPTPRPRPDGLAPPPTEGHDVVGSFTDRMQTILQSAEDEAAEIRAKARTAARAEEERLAKTRAATRADEEAARAAIANLVRQRDEVLADLTRMRGQLEALLSGPTARIKVPAQSRPDAEPTAAAPHDPGAGQPLPGAATGTVAARPAAQPAAAETPKAGPEKAAAATTGTATTGTATTGTAKADTGKASSPTTGAPTTDAAKAGAPTTGAAPSRPATTTPDRAAAATSTGSEGTAVLQPAARAAEATTAVPAKDASAPPTGRETPADEAGDAVTGDDPAGEDEPVERTTAAPASPATSAPTSVEQTALLGAADKREAAGPPPADATVKVSAVARRSNGDAPSADGNGREGSDAEPASATRST